MSMNDRQKGFENKFAYDQEKLFKIEARACRYLGQWAAEQLGLSGDEAADYAKSVVASNMDEPGLDDVTNKVLGDFQAKNLDITLHMIETKLEQKLAQVAKELEGE